MQQVPQRELRTPYDRRASIYLRGALVILASLVLGLLIAVVAPVTLAKLWGGQASALYYLVLGIYLVLVLYIYVPLVERKKIQFKVWMLDQKDVGNILTVAFLSYLTFGAPWSISTSLSWAFNVSLALLLLLFMWSAFNRYNQSAKSLT